jgi:hypothetical protein
MSDPSPADAGRRQTVDLAGLTAAMDDARLHRGPHRAVAVTMECGHLRLLSALACTMGPGAWTGCRMCGDDFPARMVVKVEETGVLHTESWSKASANASSQAHDTP